MSIQEAAPNLSLRNRVSEARARRARLNSGTIASTELDIVPQYRADRDRLERLNREAEIEQKRLRDARLRRSIELRLAFQAELSSWIIEAGEEPKTPALPRLTVLQIAQAVASFYGIDPLDIYSARQNAVLARRRMIVMYLAKNYTACSFTMIGERLKRDHSTIVHGIRTVERLLPERASEQLADDIAALKKILEVE